MILEAGNLTYYRLTYLDTVRKNLIREASSQLRSGRVTQAWLSHSLAERVEYAIRLKIAEGIASSPEGVPV